MLRISTFLESSKKRCVLLWKAMEMRFERPLSRLSGRWPRVDDGRYSRRLSSVRFNLDDVDQILTYLARVSIQCTPELHLSSGVIVTKADELKDASDDDREGMKIFLEDPYVVVETGEVARVWAKLPAGQDVIGTVDRIYEYAASSGRESTGSHYIGIGVFSAIWVLVLILPSYIAGVSDETRRFEDMFPLLSVLPSFGVIILLTAAAIRSKPVRVSLRRNREIREDAKLKRERRRGTLRDILMLVVGAILATLSNVAQGFGSEVFDRYFLK